MDACHIALIPTPFPFNQEKVRDETAAFIFFYGFSGFCRILSGHFLWYCSNPLNWLVPRNVAWKYTQRSSLDAYKYQAENSTHQMWTYRWSTHILWAEGCKGWAWNNDVMWFFFLLMDITHRVISNKRRLCKQEPSRCGPTLVYTRNCLATQNAATGNIISQLNRIKWIFNRFCMI